VADTDTSLALRPGDKSTTDVKSKANKGFAAIHIVNAACHSLRSTVLLPVAAVTTGDDALKAQMAQVNAGVADVNVKLDKAKKTADLWIDDLCTRISKTIPTHIINYSAVYDSASDEILEIIAEAKKNGSSPKLIGEMMDLVQALQDQIKTIRRDIAAAGEDIKKFAGKVQVDHDNLVGGVDTIQSLIVLDQNEVTQMTQDIQRLNDEIDALNKKLMDAEIGTAAGIFVAIVGLVVCFVPGGQAIGGVILTVGVAGVIGGGTMWGLLQKSINDDYKKIGEEQVTKSALTQQVLSLTALHTTTANALDQVTMAVNALSDVNVLWGTFEGILQGVIDDLSKPSPNLPLILDEMYVKAAQNNWRDLEEFAQQLVATSVTVEQMPQVQQPKAA
jgi:DNA-binding transcriptional MerR regulator